MLSTIDGGLRAGRWVAGVVMLVVVATAIPPGELELLREDGVWRWFFGTSRDALDALPETCGAV